MEDIVAQTESFFSSRLPEEWAGLVSLLVSLAVIFFVFWIFRIVLMRLIDKKVSPAVKVIIRKVIFYVALSAAVLTVLNKFGVNLAAVIGAAGILGVAVGFASQTSVSNIISGLFLLAGRSFKIGDSVQVNSVRGTVESIDFLSVHLKSENGEFIRVPNESIIKANFVNLSFFPERRVSVKITLSDRISGAFPEKEKSCAGETCRAGFETEIPSGAAGLFSFVEKRLLQAAASCPGVLSCPGAKVVPSAFRKGEFDVLLSVWCKNEDEDLLREKLLVRTAGVFSCHDMPEDLLISASFL